MPLRDLHHAKLFLPFDSLKGLMSLMEKQTEIVVEKKELMVDSLDELDYKFTMIKIGTMISVVYYKENRYLKKTGLVSKIDLIYKTITIVHEVIDTNNIICLEVE